MSKPIISVEGLGKAYFLGKAADRNQTFRDALVGLARAPLQRLRHRTADAGKAADAFWAIRNVNFEVNRGEVIGLVGRNGAGKSTLLKVLSRITEPTEGRAVLRGRVASLLEVGTGFHPELTGRENIYLNGAILGMKKTEIDRKFDAIVEFAEVAKFLDTPVKRYSSGMYVRLAFAVAAHLEPEILIVDEVLAVGDASFQKKCLGKMGDVVRHGRTMGGPVSLWVVNRDFQNWEERMNPWPVDAEIARVTTPQQMLELGEERLRAAIKTIGLFNTKAKNVIALSRALVEQHGGKVPADRDALEALPGVGRKTANVVMNCAFGAETFAVDTHVFRVANRTALARGKTPIEVEEKLDRLTAPPYRRHAHHWLILHGRYVCKARRPECWRCVVKDLCRYTPKTPAPGSEEEAMAKASRKQAAKGAARAARPAPARAART